MTVEPVTPQHGSSGPGPAPSSTAPEDGAGPVHVSPVWAYGEKDLHYQADCDRCGWHTRPTLPRSIVGHWASRHARSCREEA